MSGTGGGSSSTPQEVVISAEDRAAARDQGATSIKYAVIGACAGLSVIVLIATVLAGALFPDLGSWELALAATGIAIVLLAAVRRRAGDAVRARRPRPARRELRA